MKAASVLIAAFLYLPLFSENLILTVDLEITEPPGIIFNGLIDIATDSKNNIYVLDNKEKSIYLFNEKGTFLRRIGRAGQGPGEFGRPSSIYVDSGDLIYVLDEANRRIEIFDKNCNYVKSIRIIDFPSGDEKRIVVDHEQNIYIAGYLPDVNSILAKYSSRGELLKSYALPIVEYKGVAFAAPEQRMINEYLAGGSVCVDDENRLYASYRWPYIIKIISEDGREIRDIRGEADYRWTPYIFATNEINGKLFSESTRTIKVFLIKDRYLANSIYVNDWEGNPKRTIDMSILRRNPESYIRIKGEYALLDIYSKDGEYINSARTNKKVYLLCSDKKGRILGIGYDDGDIPIVVRFNMDVN